MGTYNPSYKSTYNLLRGLRGLISTVINGVRGTLNLQVFGGSMLWILPGVWEGYFCHKRTEAFGRRFLTGGRPAHRCENGVGFRV